MLQTFKKIGGQITSVPQKSQRLITQEPMEVLRTAKEQILGSKEPSVPQESLVLEALRQSQMTPATAVDTQRIKAHAASRMEELRAEIARLVAQRQQKEIEWRKQQEAIIKPQQEQAEKPLIIPSSKPKRGQVSRQKIGGTHEMVKSKGA